MQPTSATIAGIYGRTSYPCCRSFFMRHWHSHLEMQISFSWWLLYHRRFACYQCIVPRPGHPIQPHDTCQPVSHQATFHQSCFPSGSRRCVGWLGWAEISFCMSQQSVPQGPFGMACSRPEKAGKSKRLRKALSITLWDQTSQTHLFRQLGEIGTTLVICPVFDIALTHGVLCPEPSSTNPWHQVRMTVPFVRRWGPTYPAFVF